MNQNSVSLEVVQRVLYRRALQRAIDLEVNFAVLFRAVNNIILYTYRFRSQFQYNSETAIIIGTNIFDDVIESAEELYTEINGHLTAEEQLVFESIATVNTDLFLNYWYNYEGLRHFLVWTENIYLFKVYTVQHQYNIQVFVAITDLFNLQTEIIRVYTITA